MRRKKRNRKLSPQQYAAYKFNWRCARIRRAMWERLRAERRGSESMGQVIERLWQLAHAADAVNVDGRFLEDTEKTVQ